MKNICLASRGVWLLRNKCHLLTSRPVDNRKNVSIVLRALFMSVRHNIMIFDRWVFLDSAKGLSLLRTALWQTLWLQEMFSQMLVLIVVYLEHSSKTLIHNWCINKWYLWWKWCFNMSTSEILFQVHNTSDTYVHWQTKLKYF